MKKILLTLLIYIAYCIFVQCENDKLQESLVIATILSKTVNTVDPITLNENKKMQLLEENSNEIVLLSLNAIKEFTYQEGYEYKLSLLKTKIEKPEYIVDAPSFEYKLLNTIPIDVINLEEAFPNKTKETVTLQNGISFERYNDLIIWGGDMIISEKMFNSFNNPTQTRGGIVNNPDFKWPNGIVYYKFDSAISKTTKEHIQQAMDEWKQSTSKIITFTERTSQKNYIKFINGDGNYSSVGMRGGEQILSISKYDSNKGTALHEIGHALGLIHEQQRRDRDEYININWDNIQSDKKSNFKIWEESHAVIKYIPDVLFDYKSIMLYPSYNSFAIDYSKPTMTKKDGSTFNAQRNNLSYIDIVAIYDIYGFPTGGGGPSVTSIK